MHLHPIAAAICLCAIFPMVTKPSVCNHGYGGILVGLSPPL